MENKGKWFEGRRKVLTRVGLSWDHTLGMTGAESRDDRHCHMGHVG